MIDFTAIAFILAFQHYIVMLGTVVLIASSLVPRMGGDHVSYFLPPYKSFKRDIKQNTSRNMLISHSFGFDLSVLALFSH